MIGALFIIATVITVLALASRLHETRVQLREEQRQRAQIQHERDAYAWVLGAWRAVERDGQPDEPMA